MFTKKGVRIKLPRKITIVGGSGFVGTNLCKQLEKKKYDFEIVDLKMSNKFSHKCKIGDVRDPDSLRRTITGDVLVNLAAVHRDDIRDKSDYYKTNVDGARNIVSVCLQKNIRKIIFTSSVAVYGFAPAGTGEDGAINPFNDYGRTKFEAEKIFQEWYSGDEASRSLLTVRPTVIFGEGNRGNVYNLFNQIASGRFIMIGKGENIKSIAYIGNLVAFLDACIETKQQYGLFNYTDTPDLSMNELVEYLRIFLLAKKGVGIRLPIALGLLIGNLFDIISIISKRNFPISSIRIKKFVSSSQFSSRTSELDGFEPPFSLRDGIELTLMSDFLSPNPQNEIFFTE